MSHPSSPLLSFAASCLAVAVACGPSVPPQSEPGLDVVIVYDTSGSMQDEVPDATGTRVAKHVIAARALTNTIGLLEAYAREGDASRPIRAGLVVFRSGGGGEAIPFGAFEAEAFRRWVRTAPAPRGATPLGRAIDLAAQLVLASPLSRNHILVITDGQNTSGPDPEAVLPRMAEKAALVNSGIGVHFVAFDVDASLFDSVKKQGATVVAAADEIQLNDQLAFIMERKILLEAEEPPPRTVPVTE